MRAKRVSLQKKRVTCKAPDERYFLLDPWERTSINPCSSQPRPDKDKVRPSVPFPRPLNLQEKENPPAFHFLFPLSNYTDKTLRTK